MKRVLIVDDGKTATAYTQKLLRQRGFETLTAEDGVDGISKARQHHPDLILMDVVMPRLNGFQATRELSRHPQTADIPVIIVSSKDMESDRVWGLRQGARNYLVKPFTAHQLLASIETVLAA